ncbi:hypothetical protein RhiirC2_761718 [Rhizophagus irregularis]|uniref:Uncharacterized protein n=1 Tax=Rhizophagus irregularis TaxID=588596 RepID=A0A2N1MFU0_9GLOM|nr:hypothetical protein RhiirC2_761718 [Rhizophagus irregularis]
MYRPSKRWTLQSQIAYLEESLRRLALTIAAMQPNEDKRPTVINLTYIVRKGKIVRYMFGASVRCGGKMNMQSTRE